jgi:hypothetical protein
MKEDDLVRRQIQWLQSIAHINQEDLEIEIEAHYNHYGDRGVVDLVGRDTSGRLGRDQEVYLFEMKSDAAVKQATGANEILRQFNRMREYFFKDESRRQAEMVNFELVFTPTERALDHFIENVDLYLSATNADRFNPAMFQTKSRVVVRDPRAESAVPMRPVARDNGVDWSSALVSASEMETDALNRLERALARAGLSPETRGDYEFGQTLDA